MTVNQATGAQRPVTTHDLKTRPEPFAAVKSGLKPWEYRKNDRDFREGDLLLLREWDGDYTGRSLLRRVSWSLSGGTFGIPADYIIMSLVSAADFDELFLGSDWWWDVSDPEVTSADAPLNILTANYSPGEVVEVGAACQSTSRFGFWFEDSSGEWNDLWFVDRTQAEYAAHSVLACAAALLADEDGES